MVPEPVLLRVASLLNWLGRLGAVASTFLLLQFVIGSMQSGDPLPTPVEAIGIACFPVGVVAGMLMGIRWPLAGAIVSLASLFLFYVWSYLVSGRLNNGPYFVLFTLPAVLYLASAWLGSSKAGRVLVQDQG